MKTVIIYARSNFGHCRAGLMARKSSVEPSQLRLWIDWDPEDLTLAFDEHLVSLLPVKLRCKQVVTGMTP